MPMRDLMQVRPPAESNLRALTNALSRHAKETPLGDATRRMLWDSRRCRRLLALLLALLTLVGVADWILGHSVVLIGLYAFGPLLGAVRLSPRYTLTLSIYALLLTLLAGVHNDILGTLDHGVRALTVLTACVVAVTGSVLRRRMEGIRNVL